MSKHTPGRDYCKCGSIMECAALTADDAEKYWRLRLTRAAAVLEKAAAMVAKGNDPDLGAKGPWAALVRDLRAALAEASK